MKACKKCGVAKPLEEFSGRSGEARGEASGACRSPDAEVRHHIEQYDAMLEAQGGGCFICSRPPREDISLHVDHDHLTGKVRGILCFCCNNALADFQDDPSLLQKAASASYVSVNSAEVEEEIQLARSRALSLVGRAP